MEATTRKMKGLEKTSTKNFYKGHASTRFSQTIRARFGAGPENPFF